MSPQTARANTPLNGLTEGKEFLYWLDEPVTYNVIVSLREQFPGWRIYKDPDDPTGRCLVFIPRSCSSDKVSGPA